MTNRDRVKALLLARRGEWVSRRDIVFVGGEEGTRRLREIRAELENAGYRVHQRKSPDGSTAYRLEEPPPMDFNPAKAPWVCINCQAPLSGDSQPSMDPRWRLARCWRCKKNPAGIFERRASA